MAWDKKYARQERYTERTKGLYQSVNIRFSKRTDMDILEQLPEENKSTRLKELIRKGIEAERSM